jgi:hypothetical protein
VSQAEATEGTGEFVVMHKRAMKLITEEHRDLADRLALAEAELQLVREERDELLRCAEVAKALWDQVVPPRRRPTADG